ncbi:MAG: NAD+ synthase [Magnetococcales bacterium]|nr:NAD+ synthase [Magnetococcales bacterium]MBF0148424.1 NAD+ synthase [Magnetococcales bacterium]
MELSLALSQINPHVGALEDNLERMTRAAEKAHALGASLIVFPELALTGYPPEDLLHKPLFLERLAQTEQRFHRNLGDIGIDAVYGSVRRNSMGLLNAGVFVQDGVEAGFSGKRRLPNHGVFDERRYFVPEKNPRIFAYKGFPFGITICEDLWHPGGPLPKLARAGATFILHLNASPYHVGKQPEREDIARQRVTECGLPLLYVNLVGGQDELIFDGGSFAINADGDIAQREPLMEESLSIVRMQRQPGKMVRFLQGPITQPLEREREIYRALCLGMADYVRKNRFQGVILGLSGGIDSALTLVICADALGRDRVEALMMPSPFTSRDSLEDAALGAERMGVTLNTVAITPLHEGFRAQLAPLFAGFNEDVTEENIQPRIRATLLMALSNKKGLLLVTTGNKSEMSVGYATLYGDMAGGFSVLKDLLKETVYQLARARNRWAAIEGGVPPIPERILEKPPTAELKHNQKDTDSLPPYPILDRILELYVEQEKGLEEIIERGIDRATALRVIAMVDRNEYKRRQSPPGVRVTRRAFGKDRRYPITNGFKVS